MAGRVHQGGESFRQGVMPNASDRDTECLDMEVIRLRAMMAEMVPVGEVILARRLLAQRDA